MDESSGQIFGRSTPTRDIYARRVPGISDGGLWRAVQQGDRPHDQPTLNDAFSRTSPSIYQHYQHSMPPASAALAQQASPHAYGTSYGYPHSAMAGHPPAQNVLQQQQLPMDPLLTPNAPSPAEQSQQRSEVGGESESIVQSVQAERFDSEMLAMRRRVADLSASVRDNESKATARHGQVLEQLQSMQCALNARTWILIAVGVVVIGLLLLLICLSSKWAAQLSAEHHARPQRASRANALALPPTAERNVMARQAALQEPSEDFI